MVLLPTAGIRPLSFKPFISEAYVQAGSHQNRQAVCQSF